MKIKYKGDNYCLSQCAKTKIEQFIVKPSIVVGTGLLIVIALTLFGIIMGEFVYVIEVNPLTNGVVYFTTLALVLTGISALYVSIAEIGIVNMLNDTVRFISLFLRKLIIITPVVFIFVTILGIITGEFFTIFHYNPFLNGTVAIMAITFFTAMIFLVGMSFKMLWQMAKYTNKYIDKWIDTKYERKRTCTLLEKCDA